MDFLRPAQAALRPSSRSQEKDGAEQVRETALHLVTVCIGTPSAIKDKTGRGSTGELCSRQVDSRQTEGWESGRDSAASTRITLVSGERTSTPKLLSKCLRSPSTARKVCCPQIEDICLFLLPKHHAVSGEKNCSLPAILLRGQTSVEEQTATLGLTLCLLSSFSNFTVSFQRVEHCHQRFCEDELAVGGTDLKIGFVFKKLNLRVKG